MRKLTVLFILIIVSNILQAQAFDWKAHEIKTDTDLLKTTVYIELRKNVNDTIYFVASAFFFYDIVHQNLYLVTNKHVVNNYKYLAAVIENKDKKINSNFEKFEIYNLQSKCKYAINAVGSDSDVVLIRLDKNEFQDKYNFRMFTINNLFKKGHYPSLLFSHDVYNISFPANITNPQNSFPYIIPAPLATGYNIDYRGNKEFCVNGNIVNGCSGSPIVYLDKKVNKFILLGLDAFGFGQFQKLNSLRTNPLIGLIEVNPIDTLAIKHEIFINICAKAEKILEMLD